MGRYLVGILSLLILQGCAQQAQPSLHGFDAGPMFYATQSLVPADSQKELENNRASLQADTDGDGLNDAIDDDIDNDGIPNLVDTAPFDATNKNTLPHVLLKAGTHTYYIVLNGGEIRAEALEQLKSALLFLQKSPNFPATLKVIALWDWTDQYDSMNGHYDPYWKTIRIRAPKAFKNGSRDFSLVLIHELFHAFQVAEPAFYRGFCEQMGWSFEDENPVFSSVGFRWITGNEEDLLSVKTLPESVPTRRSLIAPEEHFADALLYAYLKERNPDWIGKKYFDNLKAYQQSEAQKWTQKAFKKLFLSSLNLH